MVRRPGSQYEMLVIGGGLCGLSAAHHAARCGARTILLEPGLFGGEVSTVEHLDGLPGAGVVSGAALAADLADKCREIGVVIVEATAGRLTSNAGVEVASSGGGRAYRAKTAIVASGARLRMLDAPGAVEFVGRGVSQCASCDGPLFKDEDVVVVGAGDAAAQEACVLAGFCGTVTIVCRSPMKAKRRYVEALSTASNVRFIWSSEVDAVLGEQFVTAIRLRSRKDGSITELPCAAVFPFVGTAPNSGFLPPELLNSGGYVETGPDFRTKDMNVFAAGAVRSGYGGQIAQAVGEGVSAAAEALKAVNR
ncbi:MAG: FAD-dependent oxidoreductase [Rhodospirillaceae bacterium]|jgi:thioredoxin reductase (NADPH)|nr:FAD-dependent oxidoreductase [Rhodospirillaceae bacterium]